MSKIMFKIEGGLIEEQIRKMHHQALRILKEVGLEICHREIRRILDDHSGVEVEGKRVYYEPNLVESQTKDVSYSKEGSFEILSGAYSLNILDLDTYRVRRAKLEDLTEMAKLADSFGFDVVAPVSPSDVHPKIREICMYKTVLENAAKPVSGGVITTLEQAEYTYGLSEISGGPFGLDLWVISPLKLDASKLDIIFHFLDRKVPMWVGTMPMAGCTSPIFFPSTYVQSIAENLGAATTLKLISRGGKVSYGFKDSFNAFPFDMKYGCMPYNSAEYVLLKLTKKQITKHYHLPFVFKCFGSSSPEPNIQSAVERAASAMMAELAGADALLNVGVMGNDDVYCPEQVVIDHQILEYVNRISEGYEFSGVTTEVDSFKKIPSGETFLIDDCTLSNYRDIYQELELFQHGRLSDWQKEGTRGIREQARQIAKKRISEHSFSLNQDQQKALDKLYKDATQRLIS